MFDPYRMVLINLLSSTLLAVILLSYRFVYPKKSINPFILLVFISILPLISLLRSGSYESGDLSTHVFISIPFYESLAEGNIMPRWADKLCSLYGCPNYIFIYILPYYIISFFHFIGFSFVSSVKLLLALSFILSGVTMFIWMKEELGEKAAFASALFYQFAPYHLVDLHFRVAVGEVLIFGLIPLHFYFIKKIIDEQEGRFIIFESILLVLTLLSHHAITFLLLPSIVLYALFLIGKEKKRRITSLFGISLSFFLGVALSAFYWLPIALESKFIHWGQEGYISFFVKPFELLFSPYRYGLLYQGPRGELSYIIGYFHILVAIIALIFIFRKKIKKKTAIVKAFLLLFFWYTFLTLPFTRFIWENIPFMKLIQFPYRNLLIISLISSFLAGAIVANIKNKFFYYFICIGVVLITILNWGNRKAVPDLNDSYLINKLNKGDKHLIADASVPKWVDIEILRNKEIPESKLEILKGTGVIKETKILTDQHILEVNAQTPLSIRDNTFYFPGWKIRVNETPTRIYLDKAYPGLINFDVPEGKHKVEVFFGDTQVRWVSKIISLIGVLLSLLVLIFMKLKTNLFFLPKF